MDWTPIIAFLAGTIIPLLFISFLPNKKFHDWGVGIGQKLSAAGNKFAGANWESFENNITGSFMSFSKGLEEGADSDDV